MRQDLDNGNYGSIADFIADVNRPSRKAENDSVRDDFARTESRGSWYGADCDTGADVQKKVSLGWQEGRDRLNELRGKVGELNIAPVDRRRRIVRADFGDDCDMDYVNSGRLDIAWSLARRITSRGPQKIELCANMICSGAEHSDVLFWRGAASAVLADVLEQAGYMVRLVVTFGGTNHAGETVSCRITVKEHGLPFDISSISSTILPGFFRALGHAWIAGHSLKRITSPGISVHQGKVEDNEILLSHKVRDHGTALAFVNETIAKINQQVAA